MSDQRYCDFCGRSESDLAALIPDGALVIEEDRDDLWVCCACRDKLTFPLVGDLSGELVGEFDDLVGASAGAICRTLNLPYEPPYRSIIDAASRIAYDEDRYMSGWSFVTQWPDGTTIWRLEGEAGIAIVPPEGYVRIERR